MAETRFDRVTRKISAESDAYKAEASFLRPSPDAATNLLIADIILRGASRLFRQSVERKIVHASIDNEDEAEELLNGKTLIKSLALYGASKLATKSPAGLGIVATGLVAKALYDRGKARQRRDALAHIAKEDA